MTMPRRQLVAVAVTQVEVETAGLHSSPANASAETPMSDETNPSMCKKTSMAQRTASSRASADQEGCKSRGRWDRETHMRHRDYSPTLGRFIEMDPIGFEAGDNNWYRFVANGPTGNTDPSGLSVNWDELRGPCKPQQNFEHAPFHGLADALTSLLGNRPTPEQLAEAAQIAKRIQSTFEGNWRLTIRLPFRTIHTCKGYYCYEWAYAFADAISAVNPRTTFTFDIEHASKQKDNGDFLVHYWVAVHGPKGTMYVDDGFVKRGQYVHDTRPVPIGPEWKFPPELGSQVNRPECTIPPVK